MIVAVKRNKKQKLVKVLSIVFLIVMFGGYYFYMEAQFQEQQKVELEQKKAQKLEEDKKNKRQKEFENLLLTEIEKAVDLIGQEYIKHVKIIEDKVIIVCEPDTDLEALKVRYGAIALTKKTLNEIIIAIDVNYIIESKLKNAS